MAHMQGIPVIGLDIPGLGEHPHWVKGGNVAAVVTGAASGIGKAIALEIAGRSRTAHRNQILAEAMPDAFPEHDKAEEGSGKNEVITLFLVDRDQENLQNTVQEINMALVKTVTAALNATKGAVEEAGVPLTAACNFPCDVSDAKAIEQTAMSIMMQMQTLGIARLRYLVNSAGCDFMGKFDASHPVELFDRAMAVNLRSVFLMSNRLMPLLRDFDVTRGRGGTVQEIYKHGNRPPNPKDHTANSSSILNVSSIQAHRAFGPGYAAYAATKGGIKSLSMNLARELSEKSEKGECSVRVNCISPGNVRTNLATNSARHEGEFGGSDNNPDGTITEETTQELMETQEVGRISEAACDLLLHMRGVTGQDLVVDGGCGIRGFDYV